MIVARRMAPYQNKRAALPCWHPGCRNEPTRERQTVVQRQDGFKYIVRGGIYCDVHGDWPANAPAKRRPKKSAWMLEVEARLAALESLVAPPSGDPLLNLSRTEGET